MIDHNHFICHFIFGGHLLNIPMTHFLVANQWPYRKSLQKIFPIFL